MVGRRVRSIFLTNAFSSSGVNKTASVTSTFSISWGEMYFFWSSTSVASMMAYREDWELEKVGLGEEIDQRGWQRPSGCLCSNSHVSQPTPDMPNYVHYCSRYTVYAAPVAHQRPTESWSTLQIPTEAMPLARPSHRGTYQSYLCKVPIQLINGEYIV